MAPKALPSSSKSIPNRAGKNRVVEDEPEAPTTARASKFLKRTNHGSVTNSDAHTFNVRIHECLHQEDRADFGAIKGESTGNFMIAYSTPIGPKPNFKKWSDLIKIECDTVRLNSPIT